MKNVIIKLSGKSLDYFFNDASVVPVLQYLSREHRIVIVHGSSAQVNTWEKKFGVETKFVDGLRYTDENNIELVVAVQSGLLNKSIVKHLRVNGFIATGLTGIDLDLMDGAVVLPQYGMVGVPSINPDNKVLQMLLDEGVIPVFSSLCYDAAGRFINVNADHFTAALSSYLHPETLIFLSDVSGILVNGEPKSELSVTESRSLIETDVVTGGMKVKLESVMDILNTGVENIFIGSEMHLNENAAGKKTLQCGTRIYKD